MTAERSVLIVDDDVAVRRAMARVIERAGWEIAEAMDGDEAIERYQRRAASVVLSDLMMPRLDGVDLLHSLRAIDSDVPVIMLSGCGRRERCSAALRAGANDFVPKPCSAMLLRLLIERAYEKRREIRSVAEPLDDVRREYRAHVPAEIRLRPGVLNRISARVYAAGLDELRWPVRLAVHEAFTNAILHGSRHDPSRPIELRASFCRKGGFVTVIDSGEGFDPCDGAEEPPEVDPPAGRGIFLIRAFTDDANWTDAGRKCEMIWRRQ